MNDTIIDDDDDFYGQSKNVEVTDATSAKQNTAKPSTSQANEAMAEDAEPTAVSVSKPDDVDMKTDAPENDTIHPGAQSTSEAPPENPILDAAVAELKHQISMAPDDAEGALSAVKTDGQDQMASNQDEQNSNSIQGGAEVEADSSPYGSSSDDSSDSSSDDSSDEDEDEDDYQLLDPREQARMLMADGGSDDEGGGGGKGSGRAPRTQNEQMDEIVEMPELEITTDMKIEELGNVQVVMGNVALIKANTSGQYQVLESSSVLCLEDRKLIGVVAETIGRVEEPMYVVRFTNAATLEGFGVAVGRTIYYVPSHSNFLFTKALQVKGSDASNLHDEEVAVNEMEFSDDEAEAAYKSSLKKQRQAKKDGRHGGRGAARDGGQQRDSFRRGDLASGPTELSYDDNGASEELYTPLSRPDSMLQAAGGSASPADANRSWSPRGAQSGHRGRGGRGGPGSHGGRGNARGRGMGRGGGGGGRGGNGGGRGRDGAQDQHHNLPPQPPAGFGQGAGFNPMMPQMAPPLSLPMPPQVSAKQEQHLLQQQYPLQQQQYSQQQQFQPQQYQQQQPPPPPPSYQQQQHYSHQQQHYQQSSQPFTLHQQPPQNPFPYPQPLNLSAFPQFSPTGQRPTGAAQAAAAAGAGANNYFYPPAAGADGGGPPPPPPPADPRLQGRGGGGGYPS